MSIIASSSHMFRRVLARQAIQGQAALPSLTRHQSNALAPEVPYAVDLPEGMEGVYIKPKVVNRSFLDYYQAKEEAQLEAAREFSTGTEFDVHRRHWCP